MYRTLQIEKIENLIVSTIDMESSPICFKPVVGGAFGQEGPTCDLRRILTTLAKQTNNKADLERNGNFWLSPFRGERSRDEDDSENYAVYGIRRSDGFVLRSCRMVGLI
jgi:hypothetical protein